MQLPRIPLFLLISFASVNAVLFTPALPEIGDFFSINSGNTQKLMTWFLLGYSLGQLLYGPLANRYGRKPAIRAGISLQMISQFLCLIAIHLHFFDLMLLARLLMALGSGVGLKMSFTLINEIYQTEQARRITAQALLAFAIAPGLAVALGGYLCTHWQWQSCFYAQLMYGLMMLGLSRSFPETCTQRDLHALHFKSLARNYLRQFTHLTLIQTGLLMGSATAFIYLFANLAPYIAIDQGQLSSAAYGSFNLLPSLGLLVGSVLAAKLALRIQTASVLTLGCILTGTSCCFMALAALNHLSLLWILFLPMMIVNIGLSLLFANAATMVMPHLEDKANGSAVMNFINMAWATLIVLLSGYFKAELITLIGMFGFLSVVIGILLFQLVFNTGTEKGTQVV